MKLDWKKDDKRFYQPAADPCLIEVPAFQYFAVKGQANPDSEDFTRHVGLLYALSYAIRMSPKKNRAPANYVEYTVFPLEGIWDISEDAKRRPKVSGAPVDRDALVFDLMIRQPSFVTADYAAGVIEELRKKEKDPLLDGVRFESIADGSCVQMMHLGPYAEEPASFARMEAFATEKGLRRLSMVHREIYLSDPRKTAAEKMRTVLRFKVG